MIKLNREKYNNKNSCCYRNQEFRTATETLICQHMHSLSTKFDIVHSENTPDDLIIEGYFALYEQETELFQDCYEIISRGAFKNIGGKDIRALWNHNSQYVLGRTTNGTLELQEDDKGLFGRVKLPNTTYAKDLYEVIKRGDLEQWSFESEIIDEEIALKSQIRMHLTCRCIKIHVVGISTKLHRFTSIQDNESKIISEMNVLEGEGAYEKISRKTFCFFYKK